MRDDNNGNHGCLYDENIVNSEQRYTLESLMCVECSQCIQKLVPHCKNLPTTWIYLYFIVFLKSR